MNIISISREFGSGGRELGKRLADWMEYDYYDSKSSPPWPETAEWTKTTLKTP